MLFCVFHLTQEEQQLADLHYSAFHLHSTPDPLLQQAAKRTAAGAEAGVVRDTCEEGPTTMDDLQKELMDVFEVDEATITLIEGQIKSREVSASVEYLFCLFVLICVIIDGGSYTHTHTLTSIRQKRTKTSSQFTSAASHFLSSLVIRHRASLCTSVFTRRWTSNPRLQKVSPNS